MTYFPLENVNSSFSIASSGRSLQWALNRMERQVPCKNVCTESGAMGFLLIEEPNLPRLLTVTYRPLRIQNPLGHDLVSGLIGQYVVAWFRKAKLFVLSTTLYIYANILFLSPL